MTKSELVKKYAGEIVEYGKCAYGNGVPISSGIVSDILTRLLAEYDAQRGVEGWHREAAKAIDDFNLGMLDRDALAAIIAQHAPNGVDVEKVWGHIVKVCDKSSAVSVDGKEVWFEVSKSELQSAFNAAALLAAQGEK